MYIVIVGEVINIQLKFTTMTKLNKVIRVFVQMLIASLSMSTISEKLFTNLPDTNYIFVTMCGTMSIFLLLLSYESPLCKKEKKNEGNTYRTQG